MDILPLGAGGCTRCAKCAHPEPCRMPDKVLSSMEGYGLLVSEVCQLNGVAYYYGKDTLAYTGCILFGKKVPLLDDIARYAAVVGTASVDLHDLGKNMVATMLEVVGFRVIDLGIDVSAEDFIRAVEADESIRLVGISCLLSTSLRSVRKIVQKLQKHPLRHRFQIAVGGGATDEKFARDCGADVYTSSAIDAGEYAKNLLKAE